jgi:hypothetical protein
VQGVIPIAYSLFEVALGIAVEATVRRVLPAFAVTLGGFVAVRIAIGLYLRPHFMKALSKVLAIAGGYSGPPGA